MKKKLVRILVALGLFLVLFTIDKIVNLGGVFSGQAGFLLPLALYLVVYILVGYDVIWKAIRNLIHGQLLDENFLMLIATMGAFGLAIYRGITGLPLEGFDEACAVLLFYQIGEWLQKYATGKSRDSIAHLMDLRQDYANVRIDGQLKRVDPDEVKVGDVIVVNPGEKIPLDGIILQGATDLDTKSLTGEALPRSVKIGDEVLSGCVNLTAQITLRVTKVFYDSTVSKILDLVENAAMKKSKAENFITKFARYYTPIVITAALILSILTVIFTENWSVSIYRALNFLVVSCPCALVISVPLSFFVALGAASKHGILIKGSNYIEKLNRANIFVFDKTGTLTKGNFSITSVEPKQGKDSILALAAIAEKNSSHPIARAIVTAYGKEIPDGYNLTNYAGAGVIATKEKDVIYCGNSTLMQDNKIKYTPCENPVGTVVYVAHNQEYVGYILIQDEIKNEARDVLTALNNLSAQSVMLTGDNQTVAEAVAKQVGVTSYRAELLPQDKVTAVEELFSQPINDGLCFVGDGINDAPVLTRADVGISMGGIGSDAAIEAADVILMHDDLRGIITSKRLARRTMQIVHENIWFSILIKVGILALSAFGIVNMWIAIFGDVGVAMLAILNAFRINRLTNHHTKKACH